MPTDPIDATSTDSTTSAEPTCPATVCSQNRRFTRGWDSQSKGSGVCAVDDVLSHSAANKPIGRTPDQNKAREVRRGGMVPVEADSSSEARVPTSNQKPTSRPWGGDVTGERIQAGIDWLFRSRVDGRYVVGQFPNVPLIVFAVAAALRWLWAPGGTPGVVLDVVASGALVWWAVDELLRGVNPFRRLLGAGVLTFVAVGLATR